MRAIAVPLGLMLAAGVGAAQPPSTVVRFKSAALSYEYAWPAAAAAIPALQRRFRAEATRNRLKALRDAAEDMRRAKADKREFHRHEFAWTWKVAGQSPHLLSLDATGHFFTGGAHPNTTHQALLWDRRGGREIDLGKLFLRESAFAQLTRASFCKALDSERLKRRQGEKLTGEFASCPPYADLAIVPADANGNGRLDTLVFTASPYVAGPYAEGSYELELGVTRQLIAALKPAYRNSFEVQRQ